MVEWKKIGDIANCYAGATPSTKVASYWENGIIPWMSSGEVHQCIVTHTASYITQLGYDNSSTKMLPKGSIVIALAGQGKTRGSVAITDIELCTNQSLCGIVICNSDIINKYVYYFLRTRYYHLRKISSGEGTRGGLNLKMISEYEIPIPSLSEQQRIVEQLDTFTSSIENLKEQIAQRRKQYEYYRDQLLDLKGKEGVEMKTLGEIAITKVGPFGSLLHKDDYIIGGIPLVNPVHMVNGRVEKDDAFSVSLEMASKLANYRLKANDIIFARRGEIGRCAIITDKEENYLCGTGSLIVRFKEQINSKYMLFMFLSPYCKNYLVKSAIGGTMLNINCDIVGKMQIPVPSLTEQQRIVTILDTFEASINNLEQQLAQREKQYDYYRNKLLTFE